MNEQQNFTVFLLSLAPGLLIGGTLSVTLAMTVGWIGFALAGFIILALIWRLGSHAADDLGDSIDANHDISPYSRRIAEQIEKNQADMTWRHESQLELARRDERFAIYRIFAQALLMLGVGMTLLYF